MAHSNEPIIKHIPEFIRNCENKGFSLNTIENYNRYLKRFKDWLAKNERENIKPHELKKIDIEKYKSYLSSKNLKDITKNYYLIALRALLSYFNEKNIVSYWLC